MFTKGEELYRAITRLRLPLIKTIYTYKPGTYSRLHSVLFTYTFLQWLCGLNDVRTDDVFNL